MEFLLTLILVQELALADSAQTPRQLEERLIQIQEALKDNNAADTIARNEAVQKVSSDFDAKIEAGTLSIVSAINKLTTAVEVGRVRRDEDLEIRRAYLDMFSDFITGVVGPLIGVAWLGAKATKKVLHRRNGPKVEP